MIPNERRVFLAAILFAAVVTTALCLVCLNYPAT